MIVIVVSIAVGAAYLIGALPMGYIFIKLFKRQDITKIGSGRTGGTNAMRAGGVWVGLLTGLADLLKGVLAVLIARLLLPNSNWTSALCGVAAVVGHNWSVWLYVLTGRFSAGAGTGPNVGAAMAFLPWIGLALVPIVIFFVFVVGYASLASLAVAIIIPIVFLIRTLSVGAPPEYILFGTLTAIAVTLALRLNIRRLLDGNERRVGIFANK